MLKSLMDLVELLVKNHIPLNEIATIQKYIHNLVDMVPEPFRDDALDAIINVLKSYKQNP